ncbi:mRNA splicing protein prp18 [Ceratobasidium sp. 423]|nr:mRNA splicing protein prp18 [Ceratobasidium sp. 423]
MDFLKAEIAAKRKSGDDASSRPQKYMRKGDIERLKREQKEAEQEAKRQAAKEEQERKEREVAEKAARAKSKSNSPFPDTGTPTEGGTSEAFNISNEEAIRRLRQKGQPIRLFAETDRERRLRLRALELIEERGERGSSQNVFKKALEEMEGTLNKEEIERHPLERSREILATYDWETTLTGERDKQVSSELPSDVEGLVTHLLKHLSLIFWFKSD